MADQITNFARALFSTATVDPSGKLDWVTDDIRLVLINSSLYTFDITHKYLSDIPDNARVASDIEIAGRYTLSSGAMGADNVVIEELSGASVGALGLYKNVDDDPTLSPFFLWLDSYAGLPAFPTGGKFKVFWPTDASRIFRL